MPARKVERRPNILFITTDQMRGDCLGVEGHPVVETPNLDTLAKEGVRFARAYSAVASCIAARAAILTGLSQESHGRVGYEDGVAWNYPVTLPGELARAGYHTQGVGKMHFHPPRSLMGFHNVVLHDGYLHVERKSDIRIETVDDYVPWLRQRAGADAIYDSHGLDCNSWVARPWHLAEELHPTNWVVTQSIDFLNRRDTTKPFFLWMSFVRPHSPLDPPQAYWDMYSGRDIPPPPVGDWAVQKPSGPGSINPIATAGILDERALRRTRAAYYALVTHIDHQIGRFLQSLGEYGLLDNTFIVFASDHGDLLGDHNLFRKSLPYEGSTRVPLIVYAPPALRAGLAAGTVVDAPVELRDIMPTILDAAGVPIPKCVEGKSLMPLACGKRPRWREYVHGEHVRLVEPVQYLTDRREKYVWFSDNGREQLFDLTNDPAELHDLSRDASAAGRLSVWRTRLARELAGREEGFSDGKRLFSGRRVAATLAGKGGRRPLR